MTTHTLKTNLTWHDSSGGECEAAVIVEYAYHAGYAGDRIDPPYPASIEIIGVMPAVAEYDIPAYAIDHGILEEECMEAYAYDQIAAEEYRAEMRAENLRMDREGW